MYLLKRISATRSRLFGLPEGPAGCPVGRKVVWPAGRLSDELLVCRTIIRQVEQASGRPDDLDQETMFDGFPDIVSTIFDELL